MKFLSEFDTLLMYINLHTKTHIFLKISIFCKKIITFSSSAHLMKKSTFLPKFFWHKIDIFFHQNWHWQKHLSLSSKFARHYFITVLRNSLICPKTDAFCIKCYILLKRKLRHQKLTLFKNRRYFYKKT